MDHSTCGLNVWVAGKTVLIGCLEFNVPFQHKYSYIKTV